jgi:outer membrane protein assembly factor BamD
MRRLALALVVTALAPAVIGCAETTPSAQSALQYSENAKKAYAKALEAFLDHDWEEARVLMGEVKRKYTYAREARLAELRIADIDYEQEKFASAITAYRTFAHDHRTDESVPYARFRICKSLFSQISDTLLLPPQEERDQAQSVDAYRELNSFLIDYPESKWAKESKFMLLTITGRLVRHELYVARYYLDKGNFEAATKRIQYALRQYDGSGLEPEAMVLLGETYLKMKKVREGTEVFKQMIAVYPGSPFTDAARQFLAELKQPGAVVAR